MMKMMTALTSSEPIRTQLHLSPAVATAALRSAQRQHMGLGEWLETVVMDGALSEPETQDTLRLNGLLAAQLFAHIASNCPGALTGRWKLLFERCLADPGMWRYPEVSVAEAQDGADCQPQLDGDALVRRWPSLVASVWLMG